MALTLANRITIARILAVPVFITLVLYYSAQRDYLRYVALVVYLFAALSDVVDGYFARSRGEKTEIGKILDPLADKILLVSAFICLFVVGEHFPILVFPIWLVVAVISRDVLLVVGAVLILMFHRRLNIEVSVWGKAAAFFQSGCVIGLLLQWQWTAALWFVAFFFTVISGFDYLLKGFQRLT